MSMVTAEQVAEDLQATRDIVETNHLHGLEFCAARAVCEADATLVVNGWPLCDRHAGKRLARELFDIQISALVRNISDIEWESA